jgi:hypothetical protein
MLAVYRHSRIVQCSKTAHLLRLGWLDVIVSFRFRCPSVSEASKAHQLSELFARNQTKAPIVWLKSAPPGLPIVPLPFQPIGDENCNVISSSGSDGRFVRLVFALKMKLPVTVIVALH